LPSGLKSEAPPIAKLNGAMGVVVSREQKEFAPMVVRYLPSLVFPKGLARVKTSGEMEIERWLQ